ncbi:hypothetical protein BDZ89DRAFT_1151316 [Hymenopellis radicata]|nr:hypothetical protein BDZ89DRAFT_1151316 [Hymenopellis radicata]
MESNSSSSTFDSQSITHSPLIRHLLGGNLAPTDDERTTLAACREKSRVRLASLNDTMEAMKAQLAVMTEDASQLSKELEVLDMVLHPVRSLPPKSFSTYASSHGRPPEPVA